MKLGQLILFSLSIFLVATSCALLSQLQRAKKQELCLLRQIEELTDRKKRLSDEFELKQDYMRKMISDGEFVDQIIRDITGFSRQNEVIFKFEN
jgi:cell division protein FtsB